MRIEVDIEEQLTHRLPGFRLGYLIYDGVVVEQTSAKLWQEFTSLTEHIQETYGMGDLTDIPGIRQARNAFKTLGVDPSRYRPSSEALLRRILQKKPLGSVNSAVDANNYASIYFGLPFGLYNMSALDGTISCRLGEAGESYFGLNGREVSLEGKLLTADARGPFGSPVVDSERTSVQSGATDLLHIVYIFPGYKPVESLFEQVAAQFYRFTTGQAIKSGLLG